MDNASVEQIQSPSTKKPKLADDPDDHADVISPSVILRDLKMFCTVQLQYTFSVTGVTGHSKSVQTTTKEARKTRRMGR